MSLELKAYESLLVLSVLSDIAQPVPQLVELALVRRAQQHPDMLQHTHNIRLFADVM